jgi:osmotically-inducible protein OsmY
MNQIIKKSFTLPLIFSLLLMASISACTQEKTAPDAPNSTNNNGDKPTAKNAQNTQNDAQSETRKKQIESDIRAREQRNNVGGDPQKRAEGDLASEVRNKLEANIPSSKLTVDAKNADITVSGVVTTQEQLNKIKPLAMQIKGVNSVMVKAVVNP